MASIYTSDPPTTVSDLREIASVTVAISIWNHYNCNSVGLYRVGTWRKCAKEGDEWLVVTTKVRNSTVDLRVPKSIAECINVCTSLIGTRIEYWVSYHHRTIYYTNGSDNHLYYHIPYFIWHSNGTIDYKQTARNLLYSIRLSEVEKYKFLCTYCLKTEIELMKSRLPYLFSDIFLELVDFASHPLIFYWNCYFRNELHKIPVTGNVRSIDYFMFQHEKVDNWPAKEYFFERLSSDDRIQGAISLIDQHGVRYQKLVILKLNFYERVCLYMQRSVQIMSNYAKTGTNLDDIMSTWFEVRSLIDRDQFLDMFSDLLEAPKVISILTEIWINTSDDFKNYLLNFNEHEVIGDIFNLKPPPKDSDFLFTVLSNANAGIKKKIVEKPFFVEYCDELFARRDVALFDRLVKECSPAQEQESLRQQLVINSDYVEDQCLHYYSIRHMEQIDLLLTSLLPAYPDVIQSYKADLIMSPDGIKKSSYHFCSNVPFLEETMTKWLRTDDLITQFKKKVISSPSSATFLRSLLVKKQLDQVQQTVDSYLPSKEERTTYKRDLLKTFEATMVDIFNKNSDISISYMDEVLKWCLESDELVKEYKSTLKVDSLFDKLLTSAVFVRYDHHSHRLTACTFHRCPNFVPLDGFLKWYFESETKIKEYKLSRIDSYDEIDMISTLLKKKDDWYLKWVLKWFFDKDVEEMEKFKKKHPGRISYVIHEMAAPN